MFRNKQTADLREMNQSYSSTVARRIFFGFLILVVIFILFIWFIVDENSERIAVASGGLICIITLLLLQKLATDVIQNALLRARASEARYQSLLENIPVISYINDLSVES